MDDESRHVADWQLHRPAKALIQEEWWEARPSINPASVSFIITGTHKSTLHNYNFHYKLPFKVQSVGVLLCYFHTPASEVELLITRDKFWDKTKQLATTGVKSFLVPCEVLWLLHHTSAHLSSQWGAPYDTSGFPWQSSQTSCISEPCCIQYAQLLARKKVQLKKKTAINSNRRLTVNCFMFFVFSFWLLLLVWTLHPMYLLRVKCRAISRFYWFRKKM